MPCVAHTYVGWTDAQGETRYSTIEVEVSEGDNYTLIRDRAIEASSIHWAAGGSPQLGDLANATSVSVDITDIYCY